MGEVNTDLHGEDAQSKFRVLDRPQALPGSCLSCGAVNRPVVDFGVSADFEHLGYGVVYLCTDCVVQAYMRMQDSGHVKPDLAPVAEDANRDEDLVPFEWMLDVVTNAVHHAYDNRRALISDWNYASAANEVSEQERGDLGTASGTNGSSESETVGTDSTDDGTTVGEGSDGVLNNSPRNVLSFDLDLFGAGS